MRESLRDNNLNNRGNLPFDKVSPNRFAKNLLQGGEHFRHRQREWESEYSCGSEVEYLHRGPASRRRRRKGKSQIWDSKIWWRVPRDSDPRKTALARASSIYKIQNRPLVREGAPQKQDRNCQRVINIWSWAPDGARHQDLLTDWPTVSRSVIFDFDLTFGHRQTRTDWGVRLDEPSRQIRDIEEESTNQGSKQSEKKYRAVKKQ
jgi:hypothetical protein